MLAPMSMFAQLLSLIVSRSARAPGAAQGNRFLCGLMSSKKRLPWGAAAEFLIGKNYCF
jgi:hypothetical protein